MVGAIADAARRRIITPTGASITGEFFDDAGNTLTGGGTMTKSFNITVPSGTSVLLFECQEYVQRASAVTVNGVAAVLVGQQPTVVGVTPNHATYALVSGVTAGVNAIVVNVPANRTGASHTKVWALAGVDLTVANWRTGYAAANAASLTASLTPTTANGLLFGHAGSRSPGTAGVYSVSGIPEAGRDETTAGSTASTAAFSVWGSLANTSTAVKSMTLTQAALTRNSIAIIHIPNV